MSTGSIEGTLDAESEQSTGEIQRAEGPVPALEGLLVPRPGGPWVTRTGSLAH